MDRRPGFPATIRRIKDLAAARQARHGLTAETGA
jgi:hypothetical protein